MLRKYQNTDGMLMHFMMLIQINRANHMYEGLDSSTGIFAFHLPNFQQTICSNVVFGILIIAMQQDRNINCGASSEFVSSSIPS